MSWQFLYGLIIIFILIAGFFILNNRQSQNYKKLTDEMRRQCDNVITQLECLALIHAEISPTRVLPRSRGWAASPDLLHQIVEVVRRREPAVVFECSSGLSTLVVAASLRNIGKGHVFSLEHDPHYAHKTREMLQLHGLDSYATVVDAPLTPFKMDGSQGRWYDLSNLAVDLVADLLIIDGPPFDSGNFARYPALPKLSTRLNRNCVIVLDDADRPGEKQAVQMWLKEFPEFHVVQANNCEKGCVILERRATS